MWSRRSALLTFFLQLGGKNAVVLVLDYRQKRLRVSEQIVVIWVGCHFFTGPSHAKPVEQEGHRQKEEQGVAQGHGLDKARDLSHGMPEIHFIEIRFYIEKWIDIGGERANDRPGAEPDPVEGAAIGQQRKNPHQVLRAKHLPGDDKNHEQEQKGASQIELPSPLPEDRQQVARDKEGLKKQGNPLRQAADKVD